MVYYYVCVGGGRSGGGGGHLLRVSSHLVLTAALGGIFLLQHPQFTDGDTGVIPCVCATTWALILLFQTPFS